MVPATAFLVLQELSTPNFIWCATGEATLALQFGRRKESLSERWKGRSAKVAKVVLAFAFSPGSTLVTPIDEPLHLLGKTRRASSNCASFLFKMDFVFPELRGRKTG